MSKIEYSCACFNRENDITYEASYDTHSEALNQVDRYRQLLRNNGETDEHSRIEVMKVWLDDDDEEIKHQVLNTFGVC